MSSHREAPEISKDPVADNTDVYAFVSPRPTRHGHADRELHPAAEARRRPELLRVRRRRALQDPHRPTSGTAQSDIIYQFRFHTKIRNTKTFLYNTGPIDRIDDHDLEPAAVLLGDPGHEDGRHHGARHEPALPAGQRRAAQHPGLRHLAAQAVHNGRPAARSSPASGPRASTSTSAASSTWARCGRSRTLHLIPSAAAVGRQRDQGLNVHSIALQVPITDVTDQARRRTDDVATRARSIGVWATASRRKSRIIDHDDRADRRPRPVAGLAAGQPAVQRGARPDGGEGPVERRPPAATTTPYAKYVDQPELAGLLPVLYPGVFPNLAAYTKPRADLNAILLTGIPTGVVPGSRTTPARSGRHAAAQPGDPARGQPDNPLGLRRPVTRPASPTAAGSIDDVMTIELRAIAGLTIPLVDPSYTPDGAAAKRITGRHRHGHINARLPRTLPLPRARRTAATRPRPASHSPSTRAPSSARPHGEPARRPGLGAARHRRRRRCPGRRDAARRWSASRSRCRPVGARPPGATTRTSRWWPGRPRAARCRRWCSPTLTEGSYELCRKGTDRRRADGRGRRRPRDRGVLARGGAERPQVDAAGGGAAPSAARAAGRDRPASSTSRCTR